MSGLSDELNEEIQGFELKQKRDRLRVKELKSKIKGMVRKMIVIRISKKLISTTRMLYYWTLYKAHEGWNEHEMEMVKDAEDALKEYEESGFKSSYHKEQLEKMRDEAQYSLLRNKSEWVLYAMSFWTIFN